MAVKAILLTAGLCLAGVARSQETCPVVILAADPSAISAIRGTALSITFHNASSAAVSAIIFDARFGLSHSAIALTERYPLGPGMTGADQWGDNRFLSSLHIFGPVTLWPHMVLFADGTNWVDDGTGQCVFRSNGSDSAPLGAVPSTTQRPPAVDSQASPTSTPSETPAQKQTPLTANQKMALIAEGRASLCTVRTYPPRASITVDGKFVGASPLKFLLLKAADPRDVYIMLPGYKLYYRAIDPNGTTIPIVVTLAPLTATH